jgi:hypothetical protein
VGARDGGELGVPGEGGEAKSGAIVGDKSCRKDSASSVVSTQDSSRPGGRPNGGGLAADSTGKSASTSGPLGPWPMS